jgi:hypothetical protein
MTSLELNLRLTSFLIESHHYPLDCQSEKIFSPQFLSKWGLFLKTKEEAPPSVRQQGLALITQIR